MSLFAQAPAVSLFPDEQVFPEGDAAYQGPRMYAPRKPQTTVLYKLVQEHLETWLATRREAYLDDDPIPAYVEKAFRNYLLCGIWAAGLTKFACQNPDCDEHDAVFVALSCKSRGLCPSCGQKYMVKTAMHLEQHVLPRVPYRQWVTSFPKRIRYFLHHDPRRFSAVLGICMRAIEGKLRACCAGAPKDARAGAILFPQRFGGAINAHPHGHLIVTDGLFATDDQGGLTFYQATNFPESLIDELTHTLRHRVLRHLVRYDCLDADDADLIRQWDHHAGFSVDASVRIADHDRPALERLVRYCARHPFAKGRLQRWDQNNVVYALAKPDRDGRTELVLSPLDLLDRLAELIIPPRRHRNRYWGAFAPHSHLRPFVVLTAGANNAASEDGTEAETPLSLQPGSPLVMPDNPHQPAASKRNLNALWAVMLAKIYEVLPIVCRHCGAEMKPVAVIVNPDALTRICKNLGQPHDIPTLAPARGPPQADFDFGA